MRVLYGKFKDTDELLHKILSGQYDRFISGYLFEIGREMNYEEYQVMDPAELFEFEIVLTDNYDFLYIAPWDMDSCTKCGIDLSEEEIKIVLLLTAIIQEKHKRICSVFRPVKPDATKSATSEPTSSKPAAAAIQESAYELYQSAYSNLSDPSAWTAFTGFSNTK